jgi:hypothetical protein
MAGKGIHAGCQHFSQEQGFDILLKMEQNSKDLGKT